MVLGLGTRLGVYDILTLLGSGGMGEVYRARDTKLNRDVALKLLPETFIHDPQRVARFRREAQVLASLNHPHIGAIYGLEEANGQQFLVLELVDGDSLDQRIARGPIPVNEALTIAKQIADALEAAHEKGIIHRDLKPANVALTHDGNVKVLDFGLAKPAETLSAVNLANSPTITSPAMMTGLGMILGTAAYMSPEQAKGKPADRRSDVWAFGCVLFEMLAGKRAFEGEDVSDTLASVLRGEPDWAALSEGTPPSVRRLLRRCLQKDRSQRLADIADARLDLSDDETIGDRDVIVVPVVSAQPRRLLMPLLLSTVVAALLAGTATWYLKSSPPRLVTRFPLRLAEGQSFLSTNRHAIAISPDGTLMTYAAAPGGGLYLRSMSDLAASAIRGTEGYQTVTDPSFSPDGKSIVFYATSEQALKRIATTGGAAVTICKADYPLGIGWGDDFIVFGQSGKGIMRVSINGGTPELLVGVKDGDVAQGPQLLPNHEHLLFAMASGTAPDNWDKAHIVVQSLKSGQRRTLIEGGSDAKYVPTGHLVYALGGIVYAVPFDAQRLEVKGSPVPAIEGVRRTGVGGNTGAANYSFSDTGALVYIPGAASTSTAKPMVGRIDRTGQVELLRLPPGQYRWPRVSPDGQRIAFGTDDGKEAIVWTFELSGASAMQRVTFGGSNRFPIWTAASDRVAFQSDREGDVAIFWQPADGAGIAERLTKPGPGEAHTPESWSPKGDMMLFSVTKGTDVSLWTFSIRNRTATPFDTVHSTNPTNAVFSPDGRWVAYAGTEQDNTTVYVQPFPATGAKYAVFAKLPDKPHHPMWSADGKELFFDPRAGAFQSVSVRTQPTFVFGNPIELPRPFASNGVGSRRLFDITADGKFVGLVEGRTDLGVPTDSQAQVVLNWFEELKARVPAK